MNIILPDISVIICSYNHEKFIERCIRSLFNQKNFDLKKFEIIIINDCSTDNTKKILKNYEDINNLHIIHNKKNIGLPKSINKGIKLAKGRYIVRVDSDDYVHRDLLFMSKSFLDLNRMYQAVSVDYVIVNENEEFIKRANSLKEEIACGVMFRKECLFEIGLYNADFPIREGHELKQRFIKKYKMGYLEFPLYKYRTHNNNRTKIFKRKIEKIDKKLNKNIDLS